MTPRYGPRHHEAFARVGEVHDSFIDRWTDIVGDASSAARSTKDTHRAARRASRPAHFCASAFVPRHKLILSPR